MSGTGGTSASICDVTQPLKPAKKHPSDGDKQVARCKRRLDFVADDVDGGTAAACGGRQGRGGGGGGTRRAASVARRNERERKRVSLINRTFETLRDQLPASLWGHRNLAKVSKVETLRAAIGYIHTLEDLLAADADVEDDAGVAEMLNSAERLASLTGDDRLHSTFHQQTAVAATTADVAASACERLEYLSADGGVTTAPTTYVDVHSATSRLSRLSAPRPFYDLPTPACPRDDDHSLMRHQLQLRQPTTTDVVAETRRR